MNNLNPNDVKKWMENNLVNSKQAREITNQSQRSFLQAVQDNRIKAFFQTGDHGRDIVRLFLRSDCEKYFEQIKERQAVRKKQ
ncbi:TPA: hypothetical protein ACUWRN_002950 [Listeria monocytogenes]